MERKGNRLKRILEPIMGYSIVFAVILVIVSVISIFAGAIMKVFGFEYESVGKIVLFFVISGVISFPAGVIAKALPEVLWELEKITLRSAKILFFILDVFSTAIGMAIVDYFMESVSATDLALLIVAVVFALPDINEIGKKK